MKITIVTPLRLFARSATRRSLMDLSDDLLLIILAKVMESYATVYVCSPRQQTKQWTALLLICKRIYNAGKHVPLRFDVYGSMSPQLVGAFPPLPARMDTSFT